MTTLEIAGPVTLEESPRWRTLLLNALGQEKDLRIDLAESGPWDLAGLQLVIAVLASGDRSGQNVRLTRVPRVFATIAERAGLTEHLERAMESRLA